MQNTDLFIALSIVPVIVKFDYGTRVFDSWILVLNKSDAGNFPRAQVLRAFSTCICVYGSPKGREKGSFLML